MGKVLFLVALILILTMFQILSLFGAEEYLVNTYTEGEQTSPAIAMDSEGNFVITWQSWKQDGSDYGIFAQRFDYKFNPQDKEFQVNKFTEGDQINPSVAMDTKGNFVITWQSYKQDGDEWGVFAQRFRNDGSREGDEFQVNKWTKYDQYYPSAAMSEEGYFVIVWTSVNQNVGSDIFAQLFNNEGGMDGDEFLVNTYVVSEQFNPKVDMDVEGNFVVSWSSYDSGIDLNIRSRKFDYKGNPFGNDFIVNSTLKYTQKDPDVGLNKSGDFVIAWESQYQDGSDYGVYAQRFSSDCSKLASEFQVNTYTNNTQWNPSIAVDLEGNFTITWASNMQDGSDYGIYAQRFNRDGKRIGNEFQVNTFAKNSQDLPDIIIVKSGYEVITLQSYEQFSSFSYNDIYGKIYPENPTPTPTLSPTPTKTPTLTSTPTPTPTLTASPTLTLTPSLTLTLTPTSTQTSTQTQTQTATDTPTLTPTPTGGLADSPWPMFHHDVKHTGRSQYNGPQTPTLKWTCSTQTGEYNYASSPAIGVDGTIYIGTRDYNVYAINPNGTLKWSLYTAGSWNSSPAVAVDGTIYVGSYGGYLNAINPNGTLKWTYTTGDWFILSPPTIGSDGTIYVGCHDNNLYALNPNGTLKWLYDTGKSVESSPAIGSDGTIYVLSNQLYVPEHGYLNAINPDGTLKWTYATGYYLNNYYDGSSPAIGSDDTIYLLSNTPYVPGYGSHGYLIAIDPNGTLKWTYTKEGHGDTSPTLGADGTIYVGSYNDSILYAIDPDGTLKWTFTTGNDSWFSAPIIGGDGTIYLGSSVFLEYEEINFLKAINPDGTLKWTYATGNYVGSSPAIGTDGTIYLGSSSYNEELGEVINSLYAIGEGTPCAITLESFTTKAERSNVILAWQTGTEIDNLGYYIIKSESLDSGYTFVNDDIIPAQGSAYSGHSYSYVDSKIDNGRIYYYWLVDVDVYGKYTIHGPEKVVTKLANLKLVK